MDAAIRLNQLESHLWEAANIVRASVDTADLKSYVFQIFFFKRISDTDNEEHETAHKKCSK